jgi:DB module/Fibronectin type III domain/Immunoglobulin domain
VIKCSFVVILILGVVAADDINTGGPRVVAEGEDALLTCVVMGSYRNDTVIWRKGPSEILSAGLNRVTNDKRISILHDNAPSDSKKKAVGGDVWVLLIKNVKPDDSDVYVCEVNSSPVIKSYHPLRIKSKNGTFYTNPSITDEKQPSSDSIELSPPNIDSESQYHNYSPTITHDFVECCESFNVSAKCLGFCTIHNILDGTTGIEPEACENDFPSIIKCMADGRNHMPCCEKKKIPDLCQDMCRGDYTPFTDLLRSRISCAAHTIPGLECILEGIQNIPSSPKAVFVEPINEKSLQISWLPPENLAESVKNYKINLTVLQSFDEDFLANSTATTISVTVPAEMNTTTINNLQPYTMYSVFVTAENEFGSSLPSSRKRALTLKNDMVNGGNSIAVIPKLPDVRGCCMAHGITHRLCLDKMCDPVNADFTEVPDLMVNHNFLTKRIYFKFLSSL